jgi:3-hydroxyisobutyrate dehydrogenase-like beta-hydroxyacid dehydrogenase
MPAAFRCASGPAGRIMRALAERSDVVFTSLPGPGEVEQVVLDPTTGVLAGLWSGGAYIDLTTNAPRVVRRLAEA